MTLDLALAHGKNLDGPFGDIRVGLLVLVLQVKALVFGKDRGRVAREPPAELPLLAVGKNRDNLLPVVRSQLRGVVSHEIFLAIVSEAHAVRLQGIFLALLLGRHKRALFEEILNIVQVEERCPRCRDYNYENFLCGNLERRGGGRRKNCVVVVVVVVVVFSPRPLMPSEYRSVK